MKYYEYTKDEKKDIKNTLKKHTKLIHTLLKIEDDLSEQRVRKIYNNEHTHISEAIHCQVWGIDQEVSYLKRCFEDQSIPIFQYDESFEEDKKMVQQIKKLIKHFNNKPQVDYRYA
jgi:hypothetical protein